MDHVETYDTDEHKTSTIQKKSSLLKDDSYRILYVTKECEEDTDTNDSTIDRKPSKMKTRNGLKRFLFFHKTSCELPPPVISTAKKPLNNEPEEDQTIVQNHSLTRTDRLESTSRKQVFVNMYPRIQASVHRRRRRFIVACSTVIIAVTVMITIIIYTIIMTINHRIQVSQSSVRNYPR